VCTCVYEVMSAAGPDLVAARTTIMPVGRSFYRQSSARGLKETKQTKMATYRLSGASVGEESSYSEDLATLNREAERQSVTLETMARFSHVQDATMLPRVCCLNAGEVQACCWKSDFTSECTCKSKSKRKREREPLPPMLLVRLCSGVAAL